MKPREQLAYAIANPEIIDLGFSAPPNMGSDKLRTILVKGIHFEVAKAWSEGAEIQYLLLGVWKNYKEGEIPSFASDMNFRIKPNTIMIGDVEMDAPLDKVNLVEGVWVYNFGAGCAYIWFSFPRHSHAIDQRITFDTKEKAEAWGNAIMKLHNEALAKL